MRRHVDRAALLVTLLLAAWATREYRRSFVKSFFLPSAGGAAAPRLPTGSDATPTPQARRVRVVLLDGLDLATARTLPRLNELCRGGIDVVVDVGFPTVSLPVQHVLWTGRTQQMSGVFFTARKLDPIPDDALPAHVPGSVGVSEAIVEPAVSGGAKRGGPYQFIVQSFGFSEVHPATAKEVPADWASGGFDAAAKRAVSGESRLAFVHVLRTDTAAHKSGRESSAFRGAAAWADDFLATLVSEDSSTHKEPARWIVLSDHGHTDVGGHGGAERSVRHVRMCITGGVSPTRGGPSFVHLVDVHRAIADSLGLGALTEGKPGRPLRAAMSAGADDNTLPRPSGGRWAFTLALVFVACVVTFAAAYKNPWALPWWVLVAGVSVVLLEATPSMSLKMTYAPQGRAVYMAALPGLCLLAVTATVAGRRAAPWRVAVGCLALPLAAVVGARALCGGPPPLMPGWTAYTSVSLVVMWCALLVVALVTAAGFVQESSHENAQV